MSTANDTKTPHIQKFWNFFLSETVVGKEIEALLKTLQGIAIYLFIYLFIESSLCIYLPSCKTD